MCIYVYVCLYVCITLISKTCTIKDFHVLNNLKNFNWYECVIYPTPLLGQDMTQGQFLSGV